MRLKNISNKLLLLFIFVSAGSFSSQKPNKKAVENNFDKLMYFSSIFIFIILTNINFII